MSGPSLKKQESHTSIHEAALIEARELRDLFGKCIESGETTKALQVAEVAIEHWESRTLQHAEAEEEGLYKEIVAENSQLERVVHELTRDHDLMRRIVANMKEQMLEGKVDERMVSFLDSLIVIDEIHNEDEMNRLLKNSK